MTSPAADAAMPRLDPATVERYLAARLPDARGLRVTALARILGGASRLTYSVDVAYTDAGGVECERGLIFRVDPPASLLPSNRDSEFRVYAAVHGAQDGPDPAVPVPRPLWDEPDARHLGAPCFVMERIDGCETAPQALFAPPFDAVAERIGRRLFEIGGAIARFDWQGAGLGGHLPAPSPDDAWRHALDHWAATIEEARRDAQPVVRAAIDWLRRHPPPPAQRIALVHGDYRSGNVLYDAEGTIRGVLDWEMAHLGDPIEDLAWTCMPDWRWGRLDRYAGLLPPDEAVATWERASGLRCDPAAFRWWSVFSQVKAQGIWLTGERAFLDGRTDDLKLPLIGTIFKAREDTVLLDLLGWSSAREA